MLGNIISDIDKPDNDQQMTSPAAVDNASNPSLRKEPTTPARPVVDVASNLSLMSDSVIASSTNLLALEQTSPNNNQNVDFDDDDDIDGMIQFTQETQHADEDYRDCRLFHCPSFDE